MTYAFTNEKTMELKLANEFLDVRNRGNTVKKKKIRIKMEAKKYLL